MINVVDILILVSFLLEVVLLTKFEKTIWGTYYTPLVFLMIPYTIVLIVTISLPESMGFVPFYYPSILVWSLGLIVFFLPSLMFGIIYRRIPVPDIKFSDPESYRSIYIIGGLLLLASIYYLMTQSQSSEELVGSDEFAETTFGGGLWGHIRVALQSLLILLVFFFDNKKWLFYFLIVGVLIVSVIYQVKSWVLIPIFAGLIMRLYTNKNHLKLKYLVYILLGSAGLFFLSYFLTLVIGVEEGEFNAQIAEFIYKHFFHYLTSGTVGLSVDIQNGILEYSDINKIFSNFVNISNVFLGKEYVSGINSVYIDSGWAGTNVRTFFGTLYIHLGSLGSMLYIFIFSSILYSTLLWLRRKNNIWILAFYGFMCALLFMGWFDFYFYSLTVLEVPLLLFFYKLFLYNLKWRTTN